MKYIVVQAGGRGSRMELLTQNKPKALVPVDNLPMIFHLFRKYPDKKFIIIGGKNAITYKEVFPLLKDNKIWLGPAFPGGNAYFRINPADTRSFASGVYDEASGLVKFRNVAWFANIDHGGRHEELWLDTMEHNLKYNKKL